MQWYYVTNGQRQGPVGDEEIRQLATNGTIQTSDLVWNEGMGQEWKAAGQVPELSGSFSGTLQPPPALPASEPIFPVTPGSLTPNRDLMAQARASLEGKWGISIAVVVVINLIGAIGIIPCVGPKSGDRRTLATRRDDVFPENRPADRSGVRRCVCRVQIFWKRFLGPAFGGDLHSALDIAVNHSWHYRLLSVCADVFRSGGQSRDERFGRDQPEQGTDEGEQMEVVLFGVPLHRLDPVGHLDLRHWVAVGSSLPANQHGPVL